MDELLRYFPDLSEKQIDQFSALGDLYKSWNDKINVVSRKDIDQIYTRHILHSLAIAKYVEFKPQTRVMDVGTGGGLPGIPLAIMFPETKFYLIDSIAKKITVVNDIAEQLQLKNVIAEQKRAEKVKTKFDFIVSRAVTQLPKFYNWIKSSIAEKQNHPIPNGVVYLKGGDLTEELEPFKKRIISTNISDYFDDPFFETKKVIHLTF